MAAHEDDQDLVTIRIPRRAAAMYAAELEVAASPLAASLDAYGRIGAGVILLLVSVAFSTTVVINVASATYSIVPGATFAALFTAVMGVAFIVFGSRYREALRRRAVL